MKQHNLKIMRILVIALILSWLLLELGFLAGNKDLPQKNPMEQTLLYHLLYRSDRDLQLAAVLLFPFTMILACGDLPHMLESICFFSLKLGPIAAVLCLLLGLLLDAVSIYMTQREKYGRGKALKVLAAVALIPGFIKAVNEVLLLGVCFSLEIISFWPWGGLAILFSLAAGALLIFGFFMVRKLQLPPNHCKKTCPWSEYGKDRAK